jgi:hypothetical protein
MNVPELTGKIVRIGAGDVFETSHSPNPFDNEFYAVVTAALPDASIIALKLKEPFSIGEKVFSHAVVSPRHEDRSMGELLEGKRVLSAVTLVSEERFSEESPFDLSWWRGGNAAIADISLA